MARSLCGIEQMESSLKSKEIARAFCWASSRLVRCLLWDIGEPTKRVRRMCLRVPLRERKVFFTMDEIYAPNLRTLGEVEEFLAATGGVSILLVGSSVHPQCASQLASLQMLSSDEPGTSRIGYVDLLEVPAVKERFSILGVPTILIFRDGSPRCRMVGLQDAESIEHEISAAI